MSVRIIVRILKFLHIDDFIFSFLTGCVPTKCGRAVLDNVVSEKESDQLLALAKKGFAKGGGSGGASILDLHSGAISKVITQIVIDATYTKNCLSDVLQAIHLKLCFFTGRRLCKHI